MTALDLFKEIGSSQTVIAFIWTLFHSIWQGAIFALIAAIAILGTKRTRPALRYDLLCTLLLLFLGTSGLTFIYECRTGASQTGFFCVQVWFRPGISMPYPVERLFGDHLYPGNLANAIQSYICRNAALIITIWFTALFTKSARLIFTLAYTRYVHKYRSTGVPVFWKQKIELFCDQLSICKSVRLLESALYKTPMIYGYLKPVIFVPAGLLGQLPPVQIEAILLHELAHIMRNDYLVNLLQSITEVIFFFNPALLWLSSRIRMEREHCCDDLAVMQLGSPKPYIEALISFKELFIARELKAGLAFAGLKSQLLERISRLVIRKNPSLNNAEKGILFSSCLALLFLGFCLYNRPPQRAVSQIIKPVEKESDAFPLTKVISDISSELITMGLVHDKKGLCFELTNSGLLINGIRQQDGVWEKLYTKYLKLSPYPIQEKYKEESGFGIFFNDVTHVSGIGTKPPSWNS